MIYEYAIEPELAATWHDPLLARFFVGQIGLGTPRIASEFPRATWGAMVMTALATLLTDPVALQNARHRLDVLLRHLRESGTYRDGSIAARQTWLDAARALRPPFRGILVRSGVPAAPNVLEASTFSHDHSAWASDARPVRRDGIELAREIEPLIRCCREVRLVDPYFDAADATFRDPIARILQTLQQPRVGPVRAEIHTTVPLPRRDERVRPRELELRAAEKVKDAVTYLRPLAQSHLTLVLYIWVEKYGGEKLHNRYVLTRHGGIAVQTGLDHAPGRTGHTDDLTLLSRAQLNTRWAQYAPGSTAFKELIPPATIAP